jgi:AmmeMemoRadiSam system protein B/AmmeMemoRadiSam system protein A
MPTSSETEAAIPAPELTAEQETAIHAAVSELLSAAVLDLPAKLANRDLAGAGGLSVMGAFVSAKRQKHLRGCCGHLAEQGTLAEAIERAALRTATDDLRFPRISPLELQCLDLETWILYHPRPVAAKGHDRAKEIEIGRHGIQVARGQNRGLLLPGVAPENDYTPEQFLQQVCLKAGLPPTMWIEDETQLWTFEGKVISRPIEAPPAKPGALIPAVPYNDEAMKRLAEATANNVFALMRGASASYFLPGCPDGNVYGLTIIVAEPGQPESVEVSRLSLRPPMPLQSTLFAMAQGAAAAIQARSKSRLIPQSLNLALAVLYDPTLHGSVAEPDWRGIDNERRCVLVIEGNKWGWVYDPQKPPEQLLDDATAAAKVTNREAARVFSLGVCATDKPLTIARVPQGQVGPAVRPANQAGRFYPADAAELDKMIDGFLEGAAKTAKAWPAVMVPHAGLQYSGKIAAQTLANVKIPETVIVLCPKHTALGVEWSVAPHETWSLPGGSVASDAELAKKLADSIDNLELDSLAHHMEHAVEVELPIIRRLAPEAKVVGIAVGGGTYEQLQQFAAQLAVALEDRRESTLLVISSDMNHFADDAETRRLDEIALTELETLDTKRAFDAITGQRISMCGLRPAVIVLETLKHWKRLKKAERTGYATTADTTGDKSRVVGYAGMLFG